MIYIPELPNSRMNDKIDNTSDEYEPEMLFIIIADLEGFEIKKTIG